jgi:hypothetical protein
MALFTSVFKGTALVLVLVSGPALAREDTIKDCGAALSASAIMWINKVKAAPKTGPEFAKWLKQMDTQWVSINEPRNADAEARCRNAMARELAIIQDNPFGIPARLSVEFADATGNKTRYRFHF